MGLKKKERKKSLSHQAKILVCVPLKVLENKREMNMYTSLFMPLHFNSAVETLLLYSITIFFPNLSKLLNFTSA